MSDIEVSIIIPAKNEACSLKGLLPNLKALYPKYEIIVVNDGSSDNTSEICNSNGVVEVKHHQSKGNGAAVKAGARKARGSILVFMDGDGQHQPEHINLLISRYKDGYDMVVGARDSIGQASLVRRAANGFYNWFASMVTGHKIKDLTSGFRVVNAHKFRSYLYLLPNGFSYPTTITMAFFRAGFSVNYLSIDVLKRIGTSHIRLLKDGARFVLIIFKVGTLYSPLKVFVPTSVMFGLIGVFYYIYTYTSFGRFTNMSALMFTTAIIIFFMGLVSEQITALLYSRSSYESPD
jgi:glycosyltransferase involved in cell wall biosynthesis